MKVRMRRTLSILLVIFFSLGPLTAALQADDDSRLPACCRRHGTHHCAMGGPSAIAALLVASTATPIVTAPVRCPYFPNTVAQFLQPVTALMPSQAAFPAPGAQAHAVSPIRAFARFQPIRAHSSRGPPDSIFG